jgi:hypothetical protein
MDGCITMRMECGIAMVVLAGREHGGHEQTAGQQHSSSKGGFVTHEVILLDLGGLSPDIGGDAVD